MKVLPLKPKPALMKKISFALLFAFLSAAATAQTIRYIKPGGAGDGSSWANASGNLQAMINASAANDEVWVAAGTYNPAHRADDGSAANAADRDNAFVLKTNVKVYGGFAGTETQLTQRNWATNPTILSGDLTGNDTYDADGKLTANGDENAYHVVIAAGNAGIARFDGFVIRGGNANGSASITVNGQSVDGDDGGGMINKASSPGISNCNFSGNLATNAGAGIFCTSNSAPQIDHCTFTGNIGQVGGGLCVSGNNLSNEARVINCLFINNSGLDGGGIFAYNSLAALTIINSSFSKNHATSVGGAVRIYGCPANIYNSVAWGNTQAVQANGQVYCDRAGSALNLSHNIIEGGMTAGEFTYVNGNAGIDARNIDPLFTGSNDFGLAAGSAAINTGSNTLYEAADGDPNNSSLTADNDLAGNARLTDDIIDLGAYERPKKQQTITATSPVVKIYGDADFSPATTTSGLTVAYTSSNTAVASVTGNYLHITGVGTTTITASQNGDSQYDAATAASIELTVNPAILTAIADDKAMCFGSSLPAFTIQYNGFKNGDDQSAVAVLPVVSIAQPAAAGDYPITPGGGSAANYTFSYVSGTLTVHALPPAPVVTASGNQTNICAGEQAVLTATATGVTGYTWSTGAAGASIATGTAGNYTAQSVSAEGCLSPSSDPVAITVSPLPAGNITQTATGAGVAGSYTLQAPAGQYYSWNTGEATASIVVRTPGAYSVQVTNGDGCSSQFSTQVIISTITIPNTFSPNGDGINDYWTIPALANSTGIYVLIANRDGQTVFESKNFTRWDGTYHGNALPAGVYYYAVRTVAGAKPQTGWVNLVR